MAACIKVKDRTVKAVSIPNLGTYLWKKLLLGAMPGKYVVSKKSHAKFDKTVSKSTVGQKYYYPPVLCLFESMHLMVYAGYFFTMLSLLSTVMCHRRKSSM